MHLYDGLTHHFFSPIHQPCPTLLSNLNLSPIQSHYHYPSEHGEPSPENEQKSDNEENPNSSRPTSSVDKPKMLGTVPKDLSFVSVQSHVSDNSAANMQVNPLILFLYVDPEVYLPHLAPILTP